MENYLLIALAIAALSASLLRPTQAMPLSWSRSSRHRRSLTPGSSVTEAPTLSTEDAGRVHQTPLAPGDIPTGGGAGDNSTSTGDRISRCIEECYDKQLPKAMIEQLKSTVFKSFLSRGVHPGFLMSQWLENYHQYRFCKDRSVNDTQCESRNTQALEDTVSLINQTAIDTLGYTVHYEPLSYPRYYVQVNCTLTAPRSMFYLKFKDSNWGIKVRTVDICI